MSIHTIGLSNASKRVFEHLSSGHSLASSHLPQLSPSRRPPPNPQQLLNTVVSHGEEEEVRDAESTIASQPLTFVPRGPTMSMGMGMGGGRSVLTTPAYPDPAYLNASSPSRRGGDQSIDASMTVASQVTECTEKTKWLNFAGVVLRFYGYFIEQVPSGFQEAAEQVHKVTVMFFMADDAVMVVKDKVENSGISGGNWLKKSKVNNPATGKPFTHEDFYVGGEVVLQGQAIQLYDCDDFTRSFIPYDMLPRQPIPEDLVIHETFEKKVVEEEELTPRVAR